MKYRYFITLTCFVCGVYAYTQSDLLSAQYTYQTMSDKLDKAKDDKQAASEALAKAKNQLTDAEKKHKEAEQSYQAAAAKNKQADAALMQAAKDFSTANQNVGKIWDSLNSGK